MVLFAPNKFAAEYFAVKFFINALEWKYVYVYIPPMKKILSLILIFIFSFQSADAFSLISASPQPAQPGNTILIQGQDLGNAGTVMLNNQTIPTSMWSADQIGFTLPVGSTSGTLSVTDANGNNSSIPFQVANTSTGASIQSLSPAAFSEGTIVEVNGSGFGTAPNTNTQVCFSDTLCSAIGSLNQMVLTWSDTKVVVQIPKLNLPSSGKIMLSIFSNGSTNPTWLESPLYTFQSSKPVITSLSPLNVVPDTTVVTISGTNFGQLYVYGKNQICINGQCLGDAYIDKYLQSWSDNEIKLKLPVTGISGPATLTLNIWKYTDKSTNLDVYFPASYSINIVLPADPAIEQVSPLSVLPDQTIITVKGSGFGDSYIAGKNQICFGESCISDRLISDYLYFWSDTEIQVKVPAFVDNYETAQLLVRLYVPSKNVYTHMSANVLLKVKHAPFISQYYPTMDSGTTYTVFGRSFGDPQGSVAVGNTQMQVLSWSDTKITFRTPSIGINDMLVVTTADGSKSTGISVTINYYNIYSQDAFSKYQWYYENLSLKDAWNISTGSPSVVVAVIDSGVNINHEDLNGNIWQNTKEIPGNGLDDDKNGYTDDINGWDFVRNSNSMTPMTSHGTMVASVIAAKKDNGLGLAGVAPNTKIMALNVMATNVQAGTDYIDVDATVKAVKYAVDNGAQIINMSFGGPYNDAFKSVIQYAYDNNVLLVVAAGNEGIDLSVQKMSPVCNDIAHNEVMGIAALGKDFTKSSFSSYGPCIDASLPGSGIIVATTDESLNGYSVADGTSFAAPIFAGMAALLKASHPDWNVAEISYVLLHNGYNIDQSNPAYAGKLGILPNVYKALTAARPAVSYAYNPRTNLNVKETNQVIEVNPPVSAPIEIPGPSTTNSGNETGTDIFSDIPADHHYATAIAYLKNAQVLSGYADGTFKSDNPVNRAEFLKIIFESAKITIPSTYANCFPDVKSEWFAKYVCYAKAKGIIQGYPDGNFKPANTINKVESLKVLSKAFGLSTTVKTSTFKDVDLKAWYAPYVIVGETLNLLEEEGQANYNPAGLMKRGSISEILYRYLYMKEKGYSSFRI
ncbi:MAG: S8 family serine peptidase [Candidatus Gracilibacteria bacterium]